MDRAHRAGLRTLLAAALLAAGSLTGCHWPGSCRGVSFDIAAGATGAPTQQAALTAFLAGDQASGFPARGWTGPSAGGVFRSGDASVTVIRPDGSSGWFVTDARTC